MKNDASIAWARKVVGQNIGTLREERGMSQASFARTISVDRSYINGIENGKYNPSFDILVKIANGLGVPLSSFFKGLESNAPEIIMDGTRPIARTSRTDFQEHTGEKDGISYDFKTMQEPR